MFTFDKFTIPAGKVLVVELNEKSGGRHQSFTVESEGHRESQSDQRT